MRRLNPLLSLMVEAPGVHRYAVICALIDPREFDRI
jgi:hypothetical protein